MIENCKKFWKSYIWPMKWQYLLFFLIFILVFINIIYQDLYITVRHSLTLITSITKGEFFDFYNNTQIGQWGNVSGTSLYPFSNHAGYSIPIFIVFAIWNIPLWIVEQITKVNVQDMVGWMMYSKAMLLVFTAVSSYYLLKIYKRFTSSEENHRRLLLVFLSSCLLMTFTFSTGTYDIVEITFVLAAIDGLLNQNNKKFLWMFAIANAIKPFAIFVFIPLLLLKEKKLTKILEGFVIGFSLVFVSKLLFSGIFTSTPEIVNPRNTEFFGIYDIFLMNLQNMIAGTGDKVSLFIMSYIAICFACLIWKFDSSISSMRKVIFVPFIIYASFDLFCVPTPYWSMIVVPFLALLIAIHEFKWPDLLCECGFSIGLLFHFELKFPWITDGIAFLNLPLDKMIGSKVSVDMHYFGNSNGCDLLWSWLNKFINMDVIFNSFAVICFILMAIRFFPRQNEKSFITLGDEYVASKGNLWARELAMLCVTFIPVICYVYAMIIHSV